MDEKPQVKELILLVSFGLGALIVFGVQIVLPPSQTNQKETIAFFNFLEFFFSVGIGVIVQNIDARKRFQENLKHFALSAYRRIMDIEKSLDRMIYNIKAIRNTYPKARILELDILSIIAESTKDTVISSIADWVDVIGEEIKTTEKLKELKKEEQLTLETKHIETDITNKRLAEIQEEIKSLKMQIPFMLQVGLDYEEDILPRASRHSNVVAQELISSIETHSKIDLQIGVGLSEDGSEIPIDTLNSMGPFYLIGEPAAGSMYFSLYSINQKMVGTIENPFDHLRVYHKDYFSTLQEFLQDYYEPPQDEITGPTGDPVDILPKDSRFVEKINDYLYLFEIPIIKQ